MNKSNHIAFIMDGMVVMKKNKGRNYGHLKGLETVKKVVKNSIKLKIPIITFFCFFIRKLKDQKRNQLFI